MVQIVPFEMVSTEAKWWGGRERPLPEGAKKREPNWLKAALLIALARA